MAESNVQKDKPAEQYSWYQPDLAQVKEPARTLLAEYSKIPEEKIIKHVKEVRDRAFAVFPYPCIGSFRFLDITICASPAYPEILSRLKTSDETYLDLGCAMGQDIRYLIHQGAPASRLYGSDLHPEFISLGYDLFADRATLPTEFIPSDIFDPSCALLTRLTGQVDIINAASFFHLFDWATQVALAKQVIALLRPQKGSLLVGRHVGDFDAGERADSELGNTYYRHDLASWRRMWAQVMAETGTEWEVDVRAEEWADVKQNRHNRESSFKMVFVVRRV
ncbi:class I SAM-dependent methyltransferase [Aspergillus brunneoviolaceus CBS 621.78]|uniref:Methyltransferase domain-containing protein n=1 Tax=Aspergillus brunneoviolaceus CBS 621.78 TaxID=1450534 RepID=A0ACD1G2Q3_9EURO|nr:methyltransferase domain-containing protein [Aspergillus brunneoviolaceus CBS 621.78]RAH43524.1 methyltransferase domain-containing protein [Aspergillus brunneoviolaceus CBS 621.78]